MSLRRRSAAGRGGGENKAPSCQRRKEATTPEQVSQLPSKLDRPGAPRHPLPWVGPSQARGWPRLPPHPTHTPGSAVCRSQSQRIRGWSPSPSRSSPSLGVRAVAPLRVAPLCLGAGLERYSGRRGRERALPRWQALSALAGECRLGPPRRGGLGGARPRCPGPFSSGTGTSGAESLRSCQKEAAHFGADLGAPRARVRPPSGAHSRTPKLCCLPRTPMRPVQGRGSHSQGPITPGSGTWELGVRQGSLCLSG